MNAKSGIRIAVFIATIIAGAMGGVFAQAPQGYSTFAGASWRGIANPPSTTLVWSKMSLLNQADSSVNDRFDGVGAYSRANDGLVLNTYFTKSSVALTQKWNAWQDALAKFDRKKSAYDAAQADVNAARQARDAINKNQHPAQWRDADEKLQRKVAIRDDAETEKNQAAQERNAAEDAYNAQLRADAAIPVQWTDTFTPPASFNPRVRLNTGYQVIDMYALYESAATGRPMGPPGNPPQGGNFGSPQGWNLINYSVIRLLSQKDANTAYGMIDTWSVYDVSYGAPPPWSSGDAVVPPSAGTNPTPPAGDNNPDPYGSPTYFAQGAQGQYNYFTSGSGYIYNVANTRNGEGGKVRKTYTIYAEFALNGSSITANTNSGGVTGFLRRGQTQVLENLPNFPIGVLEVNRTVQRDGLNVALRAQNITKQWLNGYQSHTALRITKQSTNPGIYPQGNVFAAPTGDLVTQVTGSEPTSITGTGRPYMESETAAKTTYFILWGQLGTSHQPSGNAGKWTQMSVVAVDRYGIATAMNITAPDRLTYQAGRYRARVDKPWTFNLDFVQAFVPPTAPDAEVGDYAVDMKTTSSGLVAANPGSIGGAFLSAQSILAPISAGTSYGATSYFRRTLATPSEVRPVTLNSTFQNVLGGGYVLYQPFTQSTRSTSWTAGQTDSATGGTALLSPVGIDVFPTANYSTNAFGTAGVNPQFGQTVNYVGSGLSLDDGSNGVGLVSGIYPNSLVMGVLKRPDGSWVELWRQSDATGRSQVAPGGFSHNVRIGDSINGDGNYEYHVIEYAPVDSGALSDIGVIGTGATLATNAANSHVASVSTANGQSLNSSYFGWARVARYDFTATNQVRVNAAVVTAQ